jgi:hypothetical protein
VSIPAYGVHVFETLAFIVVGYAGYAAWPWWCAPAIGALAGAYNAITRFYGGPWRDRLEGMGMERRQTLKALASVIVWTVSVMAALMTAIYFSVRFATRLISN